MRIGITIWNGRISPVLDVARHLLVVERGSDWEPTRRELALDDERVAPRAAQLAALDLDVLICGAVSQPMEAILTASGMTVVARICGPVEEVLAAFAAGDLSDRPEFTMPGCGRRRQRRCRGGTGPDPRAPDSPIGPGRRRGRAAGGGWGRQQWQ